MTGTGRLRDALADYLVLRRALGYRLVRPETLLNQFLEHLEDTDASVVTVRAAESLPTPLRRVTFATLFGLLAVTGMRVGEAIALDCDDVALNIGLLVVRHGKFNKARELVLHPSTSDALRRYSADRTRVAVGHRSPAFFVSNVGTRLLRRNVQHVFQQLVHITGLPPRSGSCRPRIHDLRHSFAVRSMLDAYTAGQDGQARLALISTYLGHVHPTSTYWYYSDSRVIPMPAPSRA